MRKGEWLCSKLDKLNVARKKGVPSEEGQRIEGMKSAQFLNLFEMGGKVGVEHCCSQEGLPIDNRSVVMIFLKE